MKTILILAGAIALVLISMESPAFGSPAPPNKAIATLMSDTLIDNEGLVRQKRFDSWTRDWTNWMERVRGRIRFVDSSGRNDYCLDDSHCDLAPGSKCLPDCAGCNIYVCWKLCPEGRIGGTCN